MKTLFAVLTLGLLSLLPVGAQTLAHRYKFDGNANDSIGTAHGVVVGSVAFQGDSVLPGVNGSVVFSGGTSGGSPSFVSLPTTAVSSLQNATVEIWTSRFVMPNERFGQPSGHFQALFSVGSAYPNTANYAILAANRAGKGIGVGARIGNGPETVAVSAGDALPVGRGSHVVHWVFSGFAGVGSVGTQTIYLDGRIVAEGPTAFSFAAVAAGAGGIGTVGIGGGAPFNDPTFNGSMDEVRIFNGALTPEQIAADVNAGPDTLGFVPLTIAGVAVKALLDTKAVIGWTTNNAADTVVKYGLAASYGSAATGTGGGTGHQATLTGLKPATTYHYQAVSKDVYGQTKASADATFTTLPAPAVVGFSPGSGTPGTTVVIKGISFVAPVSSVQFNGVAATFAVNSTTQITATVPAKATTGKISVTTALGTAASSAAFTVILPPTLTGFSLNPASIPSGTSTTATVTLSGAALSDGVKIPITYGSATVGTVTIVAGAKSGATTVKGGAAASYLLVARLASVTKTATLTTTGPILTGFTLSPSGVPVGGKTIVTAAISWPAGTGGVKIPVLYNGATLATVTVASGASSGSATLTATRSGAFTLSAQLGSATKSAVWTVFAAPAILRVSPASGRVGTAVVITGTGFTAPVSAVKFGGRAAAFTVSGTTTITAKVPTGAVTGKISVTAAGGTAASSGSFTVLP